MSTMFFRSRVKLITRTHSCALTCVPTRSCSRGAQFLGACTKNEPYILVTELMTGGSMADTFRMMQARGPCPQGLGCKGPGLLGQHLPHDACAGTPVIRV